MESYANTFIGRRADLDALTAAFGGGARLVTLAGVAGIGKTRLATQFAAGRDTAPTGDLSWCDLSEARDLDGVCHAVARALDVPLGAARSSDDVVTLLGRALAGRGKLFAVLDNFEQVASCAPMTLERWLAAAPEVRWLVTSREVLRLRAEHVYELGPLGLPHAADDALASDAVALLLDRAARVRHGFAPTPADAPVLAAIVQQLDGIPLAIELAAARMNLLDPATLLARLAQRFDVLAHGTRGAPDRQSALRRALDWSWDLLGASERAALAQCAVFRDGFTLEAAEAVVDLSAHRPAPPLLEVLQSLRDKSLLRATPPADAPSALRFGLYVSIREYATERLAEAAHPSVTPGAVEARHTAYYVQVAERWAAATDGSSADEARVLGREQGNLLAVVDRALAAAPVAADQAALGVRVLLALDDAALSTRAPLAWYLDLLEAVRARTAAVALPPALRVRLQTAYGYALRRRGRIADALATLTDARADARALGAAALEAAALRHAALALVVSGRVDAAHAAMCDGLACARAAGDRRLEGMLLGGVGLVLTYHLRYDEAEAALSEALAIHRAVGNRKFEGTTSCTLADVLLEQDRLAEARPHYARALAIGTELENRLSASVALLSLGWVHHATGEAQTAYEHYARSAAMARAEGEPFNESRALAYVGLACAQQGDAAAAQDTWARASDLARTVGNKWFDAFCLAHLGGLHATQGRLDEAALALRAADEAQQAAPSPDLACLVDLQRVHEDVARARRVAAVAPDEAAAHYARARARVAAAVAPGPDGTPAIARRSFDVRLTLRLLADAYDAQLADTLAPAAALVVQREGLWFRLPAGARVDTQQRVTVRRLLVALARHRVDAPGEVLGLAALLAAGWPGERIRLDAGKNRLHVALATLRRLGLRDVLVSQPEGYLLRPDVPIELA